MINMFLDSFVTGLTPAARCLLVPGKRQTECWGCIVAKGIVHKYFVLPDYNTIKIRTVGWVSALFVSGIV